MKIEKINIEYYHFDYFETSDIDGRQHIKQLPFLSIVQSKKGSYGIKLGNNERYETANGGFFIAPSYITQDIIHHNNNENIFSSRYLFVDIIVNGKYHMDDIFDFPTVASMKSAAVFNKEFDVLQTSESVCDIMCSLYRIIKELLDISCEKNHLRYDAVYPLIEFIQNNYKNKMTIDEMALFMNMSESGLYSTFKKATGLSPIKYLNEYRLSVASLMLQNSTDSIEKIAYETGFYDCFYFSRLFKRKYGVPPGKYRKQQKA